MNTKMQKILASIVTVLVTLFMSTYPAFSLAKNLGLPSLALASTPPATPTVIVTGTVNRNANLRAGPGTEFARMGSVTTTTEVMIIGSDATHDWYQLANGAWIAAFLVDNVTGLVPVLSSTATPAPPSSLPTPAPPTVTDVPHIPLTSGMWLRQIGLLCTTAFTKHVTARPPVTPVFALIYKEYEATSEWSHLELPHIESLNATKIRTVVCIKETRDKVGSYTDGQPAYKVQWNVRLVQWPEGVVIGATELIGANPSDIKFGNEPEYGGVPIGKFFTATGLNDNALLFVNTDQIVNMNTLAFTLDGKTLIVASSDDLIRLWNVATRQVMGVFKHENVASIALTPDGKILASGGFINGSIRLWDVTTKRLLRTLAGHTGDIRSLAFAPDGKLLASASEDTTVKLWDIATGKLLHTLPGQTDWVESVVFAPDGKTLVSGGIGDSSVRVWDVATGMKLDSFSLPGNNGINNRIDYMAFAPDGKTLAVVGLPDIWLRNMSTQKWLRALDISHSSVFEGIAFAPDGKTLAAAGLDDKVWLWDVETGQLLRTFEGHIGSVRAITFAPDGKTLASASDDGTVKLWNLVTEP